jgi:membrane peptidoglycan carboxypeptidase
VRKVRAIVGGSNNRNSTESLATARLGTAGSAFKPIVLTAAIAERWPALGPLSEVRDEPLALAGPGMPNWRNDDGAFLGKVSLRTATERSRNPPFVRLGIAVGPKRLAETARALGIKTPLKPNLSLALGEQKLSLLDLAVAYATLANGGVRPEPRLLEGVRSAEGTWLEHPMPKSDGAIDPRVASVVTTLLEGVVDRGTAYSVRKLGFLLPVAGATGLSAARSDAWMVGFTPDLVVALWLGADGRGRLAGAEQGVAVPMWTRFLLAAEPYLQGGAFRQPPGTELAGSAAPSLRGGRAGQRLRLKAEDRQRRQEERRATQRMDRKWL